MCLQKNLKTHMFLLSYLTKKVGYHASEKVTKISTVCKVLNKKLTSKKCLSAIHKLFQIYCGIALVSAFAERSFSVIKRIKTWLRSTPTDNSLNNQMFANIHMNLLGNINLQAVADHFAKASKFFWVTLIMRRLIIDIIS